MSLTKCFVVVLCANLDSIFSVEAPQNIPICYLKYGIFGYVIDLLVQLEHNLSLREMKV